MGGSSVLLLFIELLLCISQDSGPSGSTLHLPLCLSVYSHHLSSYYHLPCSHFSYHTPFLFIPSVFSLSLFFLFLVFLLSGHSFAVDFYLILVLCLSLLFHHSPSLHLSSPRSLLYHSNPGLVEGALTRGLFLPVAGV